MTEQKRGPGRPRNEAVDAAILEAALDELIERGFLAASMESVAERAGVAKTTLYRRWPNRDELTIAAMRSFEEPMDQVPDGSVRDQILFLLDVMSQRWGDPRYAAVMRRASADGSSNPELYRGSRDRLIEPYTRMMSELIMRGQHEGLIRKDVETEWVRQMLVSPIMAATLTLKDQITPAQLELTVDTVLRGIAPTRNGEPRRRQDKSHAATNPAPPLRK